MATTPTAVEEKIHSLGLELPEAPISKGAFDQCQIVGNMAYFSGHLPQPANKPLITGKIGKDMTVEQGYEAAKVVGRFCRQRQQARLVRQALLLVVSRASQSEREAKSAVLTAVAAMRLQYWWRKCAAEPTVSRSVS